VLSDALRRSQAIHNRHRDIHKDEIGMVLDRDVDCLPFEASSTS
jgi:hypothetical protein